MAKIIVVTSGKGGVGKTTTSASFASGLALRGHKTAVIDFDVGLRNLDLIMGCERRVVYDLINVIHDEAKLIAGADQGQAQRQPGRAGRLADARQGRADAGRRQARARRAGRDGHRVHHLRLAGRHRDRRAAGDALRRRGDRRHQPRGLVGARLRPHPRHAGVEDAARHRRQGADQGAPADHALQPGARGRRADAVAGRHPGDPAHPADRRDARIGDGAQRLQPGRAGDPHEGQRRGRGLQGRDPPLPRRKPRDALHAGRRGRASSSACFARADADVLPVVSARAEQEVGQPGQAAPADHPGRTSAARAARAGPTTCRRCSASCSAWCRST